MRELLDQDTLDAKTVWASLGGVRGLADSVLPGVVFILIQTITRQLAWAVGASLVLVAVFVIWRLARHESLQSALSGLFGVALGAVFALVTGRASENYLPGLIINAVSALALLVSLLVRRPLVGLALGALRGDASLAHENRLLLRAGALATGVWAAIAVLRLAVQLPLYLQSRADDDIVALGVVKLAMGLPLLAVGALLTWLLLRPVIVALDEIARRDGSTANTDSDAQQ